MPSIDRLSSLLERFRVRAHLFHAGPLCGTTHFAAKPGRGFLHVLRQGEMAVTHSSRAGVPRKLVVKEPSLLFYPRPLAHDFHNAPTEGSDFVCATLDFDGGETHPLVRALPALIRLPLHAVEGLEQSLALLFAETTRVLCGHRLLADRMFDVVLIQLLRWLLDHPQEAELPTGLLTGLGDQKLACVLVAMHERPGHPWSLEDMAREAGLSRSAFAQHFKARVGTTPADYLASWRLSIAQAELRKGASVKAIAASLGYANASALSRVFAQRVGISPREWLASSS
ncbi:AraC family transcriptional regulator [Variovorax sp. J22G73]|uniref:AraC family transcriptional regulator n=1 Tax=unclassified Variovorax TaxID=663243 RepID=UPI002576258C|nr:MULTISPECIES: AraC family transcriptional regulator [unclassified Variovorax]MDM0009440.1 AraC family transcriptional regulator [Variovorax sp. J22R203]MDM0101947.1 AraC family transcriptional regulator [Variovorax sp. J22G73]